MNQLCKMTRIGQKDKYDRSESNRYRRIAISRTHQRLFWQIDETTGHV